jgi:hypothetical protein
MTLKGIIDRKLIMLVVSPLLRRAGTALAVYLASKGLPADAIDQLLTAIGVVFGLAFDLGLAWRSNRKAENAGMRQALNVLGKSSADEVFYEPSR